MHQINTDKLTRWRRRQMRVFARTWKDTRSAANLALAVWWRDTASGKSPEMPCVLTLGALNENL